MPTLEHHAKLLIGDLVLKVAQLSAELDALKAELATRPAPQPPKEGA